MRKIVPFRLRRVVQSLSMFIGGVAFSALVGVEPVAVACENAVELSRKQATQIISDAEKALADGDSKGALRLLAKKLGGAEGYEVSSPKLAQRLDRLFAVARFRAGCQEDITDAIELLREQLGEDPKSPWLKTRLAEALSHTAKGTQEALRLLEALAKDDLIVDAEGFAALARLRKQSGNAEGAAAALTRCNGIAKQPSLCSDAPLSPTPNLPRSNKPKFKSGGLNDTRRSSQRIPMVDDVL